MPSFAFGDDSPTSLVLGPASGDQRSGTIKLTVRNTTARPVTGHVSVQAPKAGVPGWITLEGAVPTAPNLLVIDFARSAAQTVTVIVAPPADAPPGRHVFNLRVAREDDPDTDFAESPAVAVEVAPPAAQPLPAPPAPQRSLPWAIIAAALLAVLAAAAATWWLWPDSRVAVPELRGKSLEVAARELDALGLRVLPRPVNDSGVGSLEVVRTEPAAATAVEPDSVVSVLFNQQPSSGGNPRPPGGPVLNICRARPDLCGAQVLPRDVIRNPVLGDDVRRFRDAR
jgi:hypothetical protein